MRADRRRRGNTCPADPVPAVTAAAANAAADDVADKWDCCHCLLLLLHAAAAFVAGELAKAKSLEPAAWCRDLTA